MLWKTGKPFGEGRGYFSNHRQFTVRPGSLGDILLGLEDYVMQQNKMARADYSRSEIVSLSKHQNRFIINACTHSEIENCLGYVALGNLEIKTGGGKVNAVFTIYKWEELLPDPQPLVELGEKYEAEK